MALVRDLWFDPGSGATERSLAGLWQRTFSLRCWGKPEYIALKSALDSRQSFITVVGRNHKEINISIEVVFLQFLSPDARASSQSVLLVFGGFWRTTPSIVSRNGKESEMVFFHTLL